MNVFQFRTPLVPAKSSRPPPPGASVTTTTTSPATPNPSSTASPSPPPLPPPPPPPPILSSDIAPPKETEIKWTGEPNTTCVTSWWALFGSPEDSAQTDFDLEEALKDLNYSTILIESVEDAPGGVPISINFNPPITYTVQICGFGLGSTKMEAFIIQNVYNYSFPPPPTSSPPPHPPPLCPPVPAVPFTPLPPPAGPPRPPGKPKLPRSPPPPASPPPAPWWSGRRHLLQDLDESSPPDTMTVVRHKIYDVIVHTSWPPPPSPPNPHLPHPLVQIHLLHPPPHLSSLLLHLTAPSPPYSPQRPISSAHPEEPSAPPPLPGPPLPFPPPPPLPLPLRHHPAPAFSPTMLPPTLRYSHSEETSDGLDITSFFVVNTFKGTPEETCVRSPPCCNVAGLTVEDANYTVTLFSMPGGSNAEADELGPAATTNRLQWTFPSQEAAASADLCGFEVGTTFINSTIVMTSGSQTAVLTGYILMRHLRTLFDSAYGLRANATQIQRAFAGAPQPLTWSLLSSPAHGMHTSPGDLGHLSAKVAAVIQRMEMVTDEAASMYDPLLSMVESPTRGDSVLKNASEKSTSPIGVTENFDGEGKINNTAGSSLRDLHAVSSVFQVHRHRESKPEGEGQGFAEAQPQSAARSRTPHESELGVEAEVAGEGLPLSPAVNDEAAEQAPSNLQAVPWQLPQPQLNDHFAAKARFSLSPLGASDAKKTRPPARGAPPSTEHTRQRIRHLSPDGPPQAAPGTMCAAPSLGSMASPVETRWKPVSCHVGAGLHAGVSRHVGTGPHAGSEGNPRAPLGRSTTLHLRESNRGPVCPPWMLQLKQFNGSSRLAPLHQIAHAKAAAARVAGWLTPAQCREVQLKGRAAQLTWHEELLSARAEGQRGGAHGAASDESDSFAVESEELFGVVPRASTYERSSTFFADVTKVAKSPAIRLARRLGGMNSRSRYRRIVIRLWAFARVVWLWRRLQEPQRLARMTRVLGLPRSVLQTALPFADMRPDHAPRKKRRGQVWEKMPTKWMSPQEDSMAKETEVQPLTRTLGTALVLAYLDRHRLVDKEFLKMQLELARLCLWDTHPRMGFLTYFVLMSELLAWPTSMDVQHAAVWNLRFLQEMDGGFTPGTALGNALLGKMAPRESELPEWYAGLKGTPPNVAEQLRSVQLGNMNPLGSVPAQRAWAAMCAATTVSQLPCACSFASPCMAPSAFQQRCSPVAEAAVSFTAESHNQIFGGTWSDRTRMSGRRNLLSRASETASSDPALMLSAIWNRADKFMHAVQQVASSVGSKYPDNLERMDAAASNVGHTQHWVFQRPLWRERLQAAGHRHPWAGVWLAWKDGGSTAYAASQRALALASSWVLMHACASFAYYHRGLRVCREFVTFLGCDVSLDSERPAFQVCLGAGSCEELFSRHLCDTHGTCPNGFVPTLLTGTNWQFAAILALALSPLAVLVRDVPAGLVALPAAAPGAVKAWHAPLGWLLVYSRKMAEQVRAFRAQWRFLWLVKVQGRSPWAVFQELEIDAAQAYPAEEEIRKHWLPTEMPSWCDVAFLLWALVIIAISMCLLVHFAPWINYLSGCSGERWVLITLLFAVSMDGMVISPLASILALSLYHLVACKHHKLRSMHRKDGGSGINAKLIFHRAR
ncbi:hypothetical protein CYMTET_28196 [Cymbomonas tetramitiformis]|uniref:Uncharacterized protein n=1 Tax=Cymbomonas tetramitiformis TaxID=36881 RepID=A0AAE0FNB6_9CHLO|nr:hypothetical protein CYMTET_28196 [Cymbomonas tetramitiformis]